jgi:predicted transglutaminase-like cysteine proteinase
MSAVVQSRRVARSQAISWSQGFLPWHVWTSLAFALWLSLLFAAASSAQSLQPPARFADPLLSSLSSGIEAASTIDGGATTARLEPAAAPPKSEPETDSLFGVRADLVVGGVVVNEWTDVKAEIAREFETLAHCRANNACSPAAQKLIDLSAEGDGRSGRAKVGWINRAVNLAIIPTSDEAQWGVADRWSAPFETLQTGRGDCEDYAIVKYLALLEAGVSEDDIKLIIVNNNFSNEDHAVLAVRVDDDWLILDNRTLTMVRAADFIRATPEFLLDRQGVKRFAPREPTQRVG